MTRNNHDVDELDATLIKLLTEHPRMTVLDLSRRLGVARGTVNARLDRLLRCGVITDLAPTIDTAAIGYPVTAFVTLEVRQHGFDDAVARHLETIPEVLEAHTITGPGDLLIRCVATSNLDLQRVIDTINNHAAILRTSSVIALSQHVPYRTLPLIDQAAREHPNTTEPVGGQ